MEATPTVVGHLLGKAQTTPVRSQALCTHHDMILWHAWTQTARGGWHAGQEYTTQCATRVDLVCSFPRLLSAWISRANNQATTTHWLWSTLWTVEPKRQATKLIQSLLSACWVGVQAERSPDPLLPRLCPAQRGRFCESVRTMYKCKFLFVQLLIYGWVTQQGSAFDRSMHGLQSSAKPRHFRGIHSHL